MANNEMKKSNKNNSMVTIPTVKMKKAQFPIPGVYKCLFGLDGAQSNRSQAKKIERNAQRQKNRNKGK